MIDRFALMRMRSNTDLLNDLAYRMGITLHPGESESQGDSLAPTDLIFTATQPSVFFEHENGIPFRGQDKAKRLLEVKIASLGEDERMKCLFTGAAGSGKTALAWIVAKRIQDRRESQGLPRGRFFEILPSQIPTKADLDTFMRGLQPYDIVFVDEVHILSANVGVEPLYHTLADTGSPRYPLGVGEGWIDVPQSVSWLAATTEPGELDSTNGGALRRRLAPEIRMEPPGVDVLAAILEDQSTPIKKDAAREIARRSGGLPWQALSLYHTSREFAAYAQEQTIDLAICLEAFAVVGVDDFGLFPEDRSIIHVLLQSPYKMRGTGEVRYKMSEAALCAAAGVDRNTYKHIIQPRLMRLGFLTTVGGQSLTQKAVDTFKS